ncbi:lytic polysaccharide monooxygenase [Athelia psychrophila]|uniref:lytic cellulose monooxygenase (C4-dehydrogenating) n=1 Tax=Athelia psychrophila TaxID=1759441 RepID=A0A166X6E0_9AGAM|nr:lytic polysaccharide monooxygenase [Fibularhizoctonia sp. CBS 109695]
MKYFSALVTAVVLASQVAAHYTFPVLVANGVAGSQWQNVRTTTNWQDLTPLTDVTSADISCYDSAGNGTATTASVAAGSVVGLNVAGNPSTLYHPGVLNVYMAKAPSTVAGWKPTGAVWFKVYQISAVTDGGTTITWPSQNLPGISFTIPKSLPSGQYLIRTEHIALHVASSFGGAQFYLSCAQVAVTGGGSGTPAPLVSFPGEYTGNEPGILLDIYYPIPTTYIQPGPAVWTG